MKEKRLWSWIAPQATFRSPKLQNFLTGDFSSEQRLIVGFSRVCRSFVARSALQALRFESIFGIPTHLEQVGVRSSSNKRFESQKQSLCFVDSAPKRGIPFRLFVVCAFMCMQMIICILLITYSSYNLIFGNDLLGTAEWAEALDLGS